MEQQLLAGYLKANAQMARGFHNISEYIYECWKSTQLTFTCLNSTINTLETGVKCVQNLTIKTPEWCQWRRSGVFNINFEHFFTPLFSASIVDIEQVNINPSLPVHLFKIKCIKKKINLNFYFHTSLWCLNFFSLSETRTGRVK